MREIHNLVHNSAEGDYHTFYCRVFYITLVEVANAANGWADSGHGDQTKCSDGSEWDGRNEGESLSGFSQPVMTLHKGIVGMDGKYIMDDVRARIFQMHGLTCATGTSQ